MRRIGRYFAEEIDPPPCDSAETLLQMSAANGRLWLRPADATNPTAGVELAFYRDNYVVGLDEQGHPTSERADFVPDPDGRIVWFRNGGRLFKHLG